MTFTREQLAWAAGIFEGEGCITFSSKSRAIQAIVVSTDSDVLQQFKDIVGFGTLGKLITIKHWKPKGNWYCSSFEEVQTLVAMLWPWLKSRRKTKAKEVITQFIAGVPKSLIASKLRTERIREALKDRNRCQTDIAHEFGVCESRVTQIKQEVRI